MAASDLVAFDRLRALGWEAVDARYSTTGRLTSVLSVRDPVTGATVPLAAASQLQAQLQSLFQAQHAGRVAAPAPQAFLHPPECAPAEPPPVALENIPPVLGGHAQMPDPPPAQVRLRRVATPVRAARSQSTLEFQSPEELYERAIRPLIEQLDALCIRAGFSGLLVFEGPEEPGEDGTVDVTMTRLGKRLRTEVAAETFRSF